MNTKDEKVKGMIAAAIIVVALLVFVVRMKGKTADASTASASGPAQSVTAPALDGKSGAAKVAEVKEESIVVLPEGGVNLKVKDPFALTASYKQKLPDNNPIKKGSVKMSSSFAFAKGPFSPMSMGKSGSLALPPAQVDPLPASPGLSPLPGLPEGMKRNRQTLAALPPAEPTAPVAPPVKQVEVEKPEEAAPQADYALTGTVDGDTPMAILRSNNRSYLVRVGDWLENNYKVQHITPRQVKLTDRAGRPQYLKLGVTANAS